MAKTLNDLNGTMLDKSRRIVVMLPEIEKYVCKCISELKCLIRNMKRVHMKFDTYLGNMILKAVTQEIEFTYKLGT